MSTEKRFVLFVVLSLLLVTGVQTLYSALGLNPPPPPRKPPAGVAKAEGEAKAPAAPGAEAPASAEAEEPAKVAEAAPEDEPAAEEDEGREPEIPVIKRPEPPLYTPKDLTLGGVGEAAGGYHLKLQLDQQGAGVFTLSSALYDAEFERNEPREPLQLIQPDLSGGLAPPSLSLSLAAVADGGEVKPVQLETSELGPAVDGQYGLPGLLWEVVPGPDGPVRAVTRTRKGAEPLKGQEVVFRVEIGEPALVVTKTYRLFEGQDGFELELGFESPTDRTLVYKLLGPHNLPIEGEWYTGTFREVFFGRLQDDGTVTADTYTASDVVKTKDEPERNTALPLKFSGVENQYFAVFLEPELRGVPKSPKETYLSEAVAVVVRELEAETQKSDVSVALVSQPLQVGPNRPQRHLYRVFAGPKTAEALAPYGAEELASYRKWQMVPIPYASTLSQHVIAPLLGRIYALTDQVARLFGGTRGSYGVAIILLTIFVRLCMFPLSRKQAISAKRMQELQPKLAEIKEKYKDEKEKAAKETWDLYKRQGVNPAGGCLPALIQLPIFVGLWQALNNSVALRHAPFLWIDNLAAPDMLFKLPRSLPIIGEYFNVLPLVVVGLMLVQMKLFSPPPTTDEQEMQQKMMRFMMVFMAFMFYKVPAGLGLYFITSSSWQIAERLLLPKTLGHPKPVEPEVGGPPPGGKRGKGGPDGNGEPKGGLWGFLRKIQEEADRQRTAHHTNGGPEVPATGDAPPRDRKARPKPPGKRR